MRLTNFRTGEYREVGGFTAFLGSLCFGPFYFMFKGLWGFGLIWLITFFIGVGLLGYLIIPFIAAGIVRKHFEQRGYIVDTPGLRALKDMAQIEAKA